MLFAFLDDLAEVEPEGSAGQDYQLQRNMARAAEFLVAYDVSRRGWDCFTVGEGLRYDLIADVSGLRRIQVKMNSRASLRAPASRSLSYTFGKDDPNGRLTAYIGDVDVLAFVAMDRATILYARPEEMRRSAFHVSASVMTPEMCDLSWSQALSAWGIR